MHKLILITLIPVILLLGCKAATIAVEQRPVEFREAAPLVAAMHNTAIEFDENGTAPGTEKTKFMRAGTASLKVATGESEPMDIDVAKATAEGVKYQQLKELREKERLAAVAAFAALQDENTRLRSRKEVLAWAVLGIVALVSAAGVVVTWIRFGDRAGFIATIVWLLIVGGLTLGTWYEFHEEAVYGGAIAVAVVIVSTIVLVKLMGNDLKNWIMFGQKRVVYTQEMRRGLDDKTRKKVDNEFNAVMVGDPIDTANVKKLKADLSIASVTEG